MNNQQPQPDGEDIPLTPRIECISESVWYSNLFDLTAMVMSEDVEGRIRFHVTTQLTDRDRKTTPNGRYELEYVIADGGVTIMARRVDSKTVGNRQNSNKAIPTTFLVLPVISESNERLTFVSENRIEIIKTKGKVVIECNAPLSIMDSKRDRVFNMVPGMQAVPIRAVMDESLQEIVCTLSVAN
ncbi:MAG: hypothetical protein WBG48_18185 [Pricia sp.]